MRNRVLWRIVAVAIMVAGCAKEGSKTTFLKMAFQPNTASNEYAAAELLAKRVKELSDGTLDIQILAGGQLGDDRSTLEQVKSGALDITYGETGRLGLWIPELEIFGYPFVFDSFEHMQKVLESPYGESVRTKLLAQGWRILANGYNGTRHTTSNRPIYSIEDMQGLKLRVPNAKPNFNFAKYAGASPTPMAFSEVYLALKTNAVDGEENPLSTINAQKFYEVQKYCALTGHIINDNNYIMSEIVWKKLSKKQQEALSKAAIEAAALQTQRFKADEENLLKVFNEKGMKIYRPKKEAFRAACSPMYEEYKQTYGSAFFDAVEEAR